VRLASWVFSKADFSFALRSFRDLCVSPVNIGLKTLTAENAEEAQRNLDQDTDVTCDGFAATNVDSIIASSKESSFICTQRISLEFKLQLGFFGSLKAEL